MNNLTPGEKPLNILLVDDDDMDVKALERAFRRDKIGNSDVVRAVDGIEALEMLKGANGKTKPPSPRILLIDLNMPRMNGIELVQALRKDDELRQSVVFILTTSKRDEDKMAAYDLNVAGYIAKATAAEDMRNLVSLMHSYGRIVELP
jgi:CheY-like chemotaxis protein